VEGVEVGTRTRAGTGTDNGGTRGFTLRSDNGREHILRSSPSSEACRVGGRVAVVRTLSRGGQGDDGPLIRSGWWSGVGRAGNSVRVDARCRAVRPRGVPRRRPNKWCRARNRGAAPVLSRVTGHEHRTARDSFRSVASVVWRDDGPSHPRTDGDRDSARVVGDGEPSTRSSCAIQNWCRRGPNRVTGAAVPRSSPALFAPSVAPVRSIARPSRRWGLGTGPN
jgi:hypothetical protein